jgi:NADPH:quinone reductase-like Zn-dependent oxidoreductase
MRAIGLETFESGPAVLDIAVPAAGPGEVLVKVKHSSINGFDAAVAAGALKDYMEHRFPVVLGKDFAGTVEAIGEGVTKVQEGDAVFGVLVRDYVGDGTFADYVAVPEAIGLARIPDGLDPLQAGALGVAGAAAHASIAAVSPSRGDRVLISGATGGVGSLAIQLARRRGATVIATARPGAAAAFVSRLGAEHVIDYTGDLPSQVRAIAPDGVDAVIHLAGDALEIASLVRPGGRFASTVSVGADQIGRPDLHAVAVMATPTREVLEDLAALVAKGEIELPLTRTVVLEEVPRAIADFSQGTLGKIGVSLS